MNKNYESNISKEISNHKKREHNENNFFYNTQFLNSSVLVSSSSLQSLFKIPFNQPSKIVCNKPNKLKIPNIENYKQSCNTMNESTKRDSINISTKNKKVPINILIYKKESTHDQTNNSQNCSNNSYMKSVIHEWRKNLQKSSSSNIIGRNIKLVKNKSQLLTERKNSEKNNFDKLNLTFTKEKDFSKINVNFSTLKSLINVANANKNPNDLKDYNHSRKEKEKIMKIYPISNAFSEHKKNFMKKKVLKIKQLREKLFNQPKTEYNGIELDSKLNIQDNKFLTDSNFKKYKDCFKLHVQQSTKNIQSTFSNIFHLTNPVSYSKNFKSYQDAINIHNDDHIKKQIKIKLKNYKLAKKLAEDISLEIKKQMIELNHEKIKYFKMTLRRCILTAALNFKRLNISIKEFFYEKHIFSTPYELKEFKYLVDAIKENDSYHMIKLLKKNKLIVHNFDYVNKFNVKLINCLV